MKNNFVTLSIFCLALSILVGSWLISNALRENHIITENQNDQYRYQLVSANDNNIIIMDQKTGEYWRKYVPSNEGPTNWEKENTPIEK